MEDAVKEVLAVEAELGRLGRVRRAAEPAAEAGDVPAYTQLEAAEELWRSLDDGRRRLLWKMSDAEHCRLEVLRENRKKE